MGKSRQKYSPSQQAEKEILTAQRIKEVGREIAADPLD